MVSVLAADFIAANFNSATNASFSSESRSVSHVYISSSSSLQCGPIIFFVASRGVRARLPPSILKAKQCHWLNYFIILRKSVGSGGRAAVSWPAWQRNSMRCFFL
jgi:hypothetical protein